MHALRNVTSKLPERHHTEVKARWWKTFDEAGSPAEARRGLEQIIADYRTSYPSAMAVIERDLDALVTHLRWPSEHRKRIRTTNLLERTFVEVRRRTKVIGRFPGETSALSLIWAVLELSSRGWRGVAMTPKTVAEIERIRRQQNTSGTTEHRGGRRRLASTPAELRPPTFTRKWDVTVVRFVADLPDFARPRLRCSIASHARGRWFEPSRAHQKSPAYTKGETFQGGLWTGWNRPWQRVPGFMGWASASCSSRCAARSVALAPGRHRLTSPATSVTMKT